MGRHFLEIPYAYRHKEHVRHIFLAASVLEVRNTLSENHTVWSAGRREIGLVMVYVYFRALIR